MKLVITEKKSVAEAIAKVLNAKKRENGFFISDSNMLDIKKVYSTKTVDSSKDCNELYSHSIKINEGNGYVVAWCIGHLLGLAEPQAYDEKYAKWWYEDLPIAPQNWQYTVAPDKKKQVKILSYLMKRTDVDVVVNACDAGREGELIFRLVYNHCKCKTPIQRLWISSMEESAILNGFNNLKDGKDCIKFFCISYWQYYLVCTDKFFFTTITFRDIYSVC